MRARALALGWPAGYPGHGGALHRLAQGRHGPDKLVQALHHALQGLVGGVGGGVRLQRGKQDSGGAEAVVLPGSKHEVGLGKAESQVFRSKSWIMVVGAGRGRVGAGLGSGGLGRGRFA